MTGISPMVMPILMKRCMKMQQATQYPYILVNPSRLLSAFFIILHIRNMYRMITTHDPTNPHSSPMVQKMKSVLCSGTNPYVVCVPLRYPFPVRPPDPIAIIDWFTLYPTPAGSSFIPRSTSIRLR